MKLEKCIYINLNSCTERHFGIQFMLNGLGFKETVTRYDAKYGGNYESAIKVCDAAISDGFNWFSKVIESYDEAREWHMEANDVAYQWSQASVLRKISHCDSDKAYMVILDDSFLYKNYEDWQMLIDPIENLKVIQCSRWKEDGWEQKEDNKKSDYPNLYNGFKFAGDHAVIYTTDGADWMLSQMEEVSTYFPEFQIYRNNSNQTEGLYSIINADKWCSHITNIGVFKNIR